MFILNLPEYLRLAPWHSSAVSVWVYGWFGESTTTIGDECDSDVLPVERDGVCIESPDNRILIDCTLDGVCSKEDRRGDVDSDMGVFDTATGWFASIWWAWEVAGAGESTSLVPLLSPWDWLDARLAPLCWTAKAAAPLSGTLAEWAFNAAWIACFFSSLSFSHAS